MPSTERVNEPGGRCQICSRLLNDQADPVRSMDCGGDCLKCMADCGDPDCIAEMAKLEPDQYSVNE